MTGKVEREGVYMEIKSLKIQFCDEEKKLMLERIDECLTSGNISSGKFVKALEEEFVKITGCKHAIAVNSGTSSIEIVMRILGVQGKEVLVPTNTFLATASAVRFAGGMVKLVDIDKKTCSVSLEELKKRRTDKTTGVIVVHIGGIITPQMQAIKEWCNAEGLWLFEDAAHAHGSQLAGISAGKFGIAGSFSLFATKIITSGEGGIIVTDDDNIAENARLFRNHGKPMEWVTYSVIEGSNYRMSDITGAIGLTQTETLDDIIAKREKIANIYTTFLSEYFPELELVLPVDRSSWYKYIVLLPEGVSRDIVKDKMKEKGIGLQGEVYAIPLHQQPVAKLLGVDCEFQVADDVCKRQICLPIYPSLSAEEAHIVVEELSKTIKEEMN